MIKLPTLPTVAFANRTRETHRMVTESGASGSASRHHRDIGPIGTVARLVVGILLVGIIVSSQLLTAGHLTLITWVLGLIGFPALVLAWHFWRIRRQSERFVDTSLTSFVLSLVLPLTFYLIGLYVGFLWFTSDATMIFIGSSLLIAALRGSAGCEFLALSNWLLHRSDQVACAVFTPIDSLDQRGSSS